MKFRRRYWTSSKVADFIRGTDKMYAGTGDEWKQWKTNAKNKHPIRFWIAEELLGHIQGIIMFPVDFVYSVKYYIVNRWIDESHALAAHPQNIRRGSYMDLGDRIFFCMFDELVDYVEIEKAYCNVRWNEEELKKMSWWQAGIWRLRTYRDRHAGLDYLKWEMSLDDGLDHQAKAAKEIYELYKWYTEVYPNRPDPYVESGWHDHCEDRTDRGIGFLETDPDEDVEEKNKILDRLREIEEQYEDEENEMLIRLIKIRKSLWT